MNAQPLRDYFEEAMKLDAELRPRYIEQEVADPAQRRALLQMVRHAEAMGDFLERPAIEEHERLVRPFGDRIGEYELIRELGYGGMGVVYQAKEPPPLSRFVAIKTLHSAARRSAAAARRFEHEAHVVGSLKHPGIVSVYRYGIEDDFHYIVMQYIEGETLESKIDRWRTDAGTEPGARLRQIASIISQVAEALDYAHARGVIHRDVKPSNIIIDKHDQAYLTDFGIALVTSSETMHTVGPLGTIPYMSPERLQETSKPLDHRSDIFSLGIVLYEAVATHKPFGQDNPHNLHDVMRAICTLPPRRLRRQGNGVSRSLEIVCRKALEKSPARRYQTAAHFAGDLRCYRDGRPIMASAPGPVRTAAMWSMSHRFVLVSAAGLAVCVFAAVGAYAVAHERRERLAWLSVDSDIPGRVFISSIDAVNAAEVSGSRRLGDVAPALDTRLPVGVYRLFFVSADGKRCSEATLSLLRAGSVQRTALRLCAAPPGRPTADERAPAVYATIVGADDDEGMVHVEGDEYSIGKRGAQHPVLAPRSVKLDPFLIDAREVSNREYRAFVDATGRSWPRHWVLFGYDEKLADRPVVSVSFDDAQAYARWRGKRLPTVSEWEAATRGSAGRLYPWGDTPPADEGLEPQLDDLLAVRYGDEEQLYRSYAARTVPTGVDQHNASLGGILHALDNVRELTESVFVADNAVAYKGGSWTDSPRYWTLADTETYPLDRVSFQLGFRCARSVPPPP